MEESIVARQPVLDVNQNVMAYEIIFKNSYDSRIKRMSMNITAEEINNDVEFIEQKNLSDGKRIFINFTGDLIENEVSKLISKDNLGIVVSEDIKNTPDVIEAIEELKNEGTLIILKDFNISEPNTTFIKYADVIELDFNQYSSKEHKMIIDILRNKSNKKLKFLATNINEHKQFKAAKDAGYDYFQGIFFTRNDIVADKNMPGYKINYLNFLKELNKDDLDFEKLGEIIKNDMSMTVSLLRTINAAYYGYQVSSIKQASTLLGIKGLKNWSLIYLAEGLRNDKPDILFANTLIRAKFAEALAKDFDIEDKSNELFTMGMLSMMDAFLDRPLVELLREISLSEDIKDALLRQEGIYGEILELVVAFERVKWKKIRVIEKEKGLNSRKLYNKYLSAVDFAYETMNIFMENS